MAMAKIEPVLELFQIGGSSIKVNRTKVKTQTKKIDQIYNSQKSFHVTKINSVTLKEDANNAKKAAKIVKMTVVNALIVMQAIDQKMANVKHVMMNSVLSAKKAKESVRIVNWHTT